MTTPLRPTFPAVCFIILSATLFLSGLGTLGGVVILFNHFPAGAPIYIVPALALNGLLCLILAVLCGLSAWKLFKQKPKAQTFSGLVWALVAGFTIWILAFDALSGWSIGGIAEILTWGVLEALIANYLIKARRTEP